MTEKDTFHAETHGKGRITIPKLTREKLGIDPSGGTVTVIIKPFEED